MSVNLDNYVEVHERIAAFYEKHPEGSLQSAYEVVTLNDAAVIVVKAKAYRTPDDQRPGIGLASEPVPGKTPYTKDSELMNAETSAWGRAIASLGFEVHKGIASANEVRARGGSDDPDKAPAASPKQKGLITRRCNELGVTTEMKAKLYEWAGGEPFTVPKASKLIEVLVEAKDFLGVSEVTGIPLEVNDLPVEDVPPEPEESLEDVPLS